MRAIIVVSGTGSSHVVQIRGFESSYQAKGLRISSGGGWVTNVVTDERVTMAHKRRGLLGEARDIAGPQRGQPPLDRAAGFFPADPRIRRSMVIASIQLESAPARDG